MVAEEVENHFVNSRGQKLFYRSREVNNSKACVIFCHGVGEHSGRFGGLFDDLTANQLSVYALDHHGHGQSDGERVFCEQFSDYVDDVMAFRIRIENQLKKPQPFYLMGVSMGGLISCHLIMTSDCVKWAGLILSSPAIGVDLNCVLKLQKPFASILSYLTPHLAIVPAVNPKNLNRDPKTVQEYVDDPLNVLGPLKVRVGEQVMVAMNAITPEVFTLPILILHGTKDVVTSPNQSHQFYDKIPAEDKQYEAITDAYHCLLHEPAIKQQINDMILKWLNKQIAQ